MQCNAEQRASEEETTYYVSNKVTSQGWIDTKNEDTTRSAGCYPKLVAVLFACRF